MVVPFPFLADKGTVEVIVQIWHRNIETMGFLHKSIRMGHHINSMIYQNSTGKSGIGCLAAEQLQDLL